MIELPLYERVFEELFNKIRFGYYQPGDILPSEKEMESIYGMSRAPIRQALAKLANHGLIERKPGKGTFVSQNEINDYNETLGGFSKHFSDRKNSITCKTLKVEKIKADFKVADNLLLNKGNKVTHVFRLRYENNIPIFYLNHYCPNIKPERVIEEGNFFSMRYLLIEKFGIEIDYVSETLKAFKAVGDIAKFLKVDEGFPLLEIERISYNKEYRPVQYLQYYVKTDNWDYRVMFNKVNKDI